VLHVPSLASARLGAAPIGTRNPGWESRHRRQAIWMNSRSANGVFAGEPYMYPHTLAFLVDCKCAQEVLCTLCRAACRQGSLAKDCGGVSGRLVGWWDRGKETTQTILHLSSLLCLLSSGWNDRTTPCWETVSQGGNCPEMECRSKYVGAFCIFASVSVDCSPLKGAGNIFPTTVERVLGQKWNVQRETPFKLGWRFHGGRPSGHPRTSH